MSYVILDENSDWLYLAPSFGDESGGGRSCWEWGVFCRMNARDTGMLLNGKPNPHRPLVYAVNRHCVAAVIDVPEDEGQADSGAPNPGA